MGDRRGSASARRILIIGLWLVTGVGIGAVVGGLLGNMGLWLVVGAVAGAALGLLLSFRTL